MLSILFSFIFSTREERVLGRKKTIENEGCLLWPSMELYHQPTLSLLSRCKSSNDINQLHGRLITTGLVKNVSLTTKLILNFTRSDNPALIRFARYVFLSEQVVQTHLDPFTWNAIIKTFSHGTDDAEQSVVIFSNMLDNGVSADKYTLSLVLKACSRVGLLKEGMQIHGFLRKLDIGSELYVQNCLISLYLRCGKFEFARRVFNTMPQRDSVTYNSMIDGYVKTGLVKLARDIFDCMPVADKNIVSWNSMIRGYLQSSDGFEVAWELFDEMPKKDLVSWNLMIDGYVKRGRMDVARDLFDQMGIKDVISWGTMIDGYTKAGRVDVARELFDLMLKKDTVVFNVMISGYAQNGKYKEALELFYDMINEDSIVPDRTTLSVALSACAHLGVINEGVEIHRYVIERGLKVADKLGVALIDMYSKCGSIENALKVFEDLEEKNVDHWNAMIVGFAIHGLGGVAFKLLMGMERIHQKPDDITFVGVLSACGHSGLVKEGKMCFELMRRVHKIEPKLQHYGCMVDILGRAGRIEEARRFIDEMPFEPNNIIWRSFLNHCKNHENFTGEPTGKYLIKSDPQYPGSYVLLSNIYAGFSMWDDVKNIRLMMRKRDLKKVPGCSSIELTGVVQEFFAGDKSHSWSDEVYSMLNSLYAPEVTGGVDKSRNESSSLLC